MNSQLWGHPIGRCCKFCGWRSQSLAFFGRNLAVPVQSISTSNCNWSAIMHFHHSGSWQMDGNSYFWHQYIEYLPIIVLLCLVVCRCCTGVWCKSLGTRWQNFVIKQANHLSDLMSGISLDNSDVLVSFLKTSLCCFVMFCRFLRGFLEVYCLFLFVNKLFARLLTRPTWSLCAWRYKRSASTSAGMVPLGVCHVSDT